MDKRQLIGSATRYIAGRHAVQTVYWRRTAEDGKGLLKTTKMTFFGKNEGPNKIDSAEMFAKVRERYT
ncbi:JH-inducible protein [Danaus plexippus plexippus]|uniref:JH-inducible protein n=1 Tax=Danaus plexippus plexippus TaxID=278856 RepID=A0A212F104_DANPL|nr:JH-inducible protein [Danaus plexippus plexippus]